MAGHQQYPAQLAGGRYLRALQVVAPFNFALVALDAEGVAILALLSQPVGKPQTLFKHPVLRRERAGIDQLPVAAILPAAMELYLDRTLDTREQHLGVNLQGIIHLDKRRYAQLLDDKVHRLLIDTHPDGKDRHPAAERDGVESPDGRSPGVVAAIGEDDDARKRVPLEFLDHLDESIANPGLALGRGRRLSVDEGSDLLELRAEGEEG